MRILWNIEFRHFASYDYSTPLMHIPVQRTGLEGDTKEEALQELMSWASPGGRIEILSIEPAPEWLQPKPRKEGTDACPE